MLKINCRDGRTLTFDLLDEADAARWRQCQSDPHFQDQISGAGINHDGTLHALPLPSGFRRVQFEAEVLHRRNGKPDERVAAERLTCYADQVRFSMTVHHGVRPKVVRYQAARIGRMRYNPALHGPVKGGN